jgi:hypothetical protein
MFNLKRSSNKLLLVTWVFSNIERKILMPVIDLSKDLNTMLVLWNLIMNQHVRNFFRMKHFSRMTDSLQNGFPKSLKTFIDSFFINRFFYAVIDSLWLKIGISLSLRLVNEG